MKRPRLTTLLPAIAFALAVPAWAIAPSDKPVQDGTSAASDHAGPTTGSMDSDNRGATKPGAAKKQAHGPTAVMDRAAPTEKAGTAESRGKHPPTTRMDRSTPDVKSPASTSSGSKDSESTSNAK
jgi:hypothetical protein